MILSVQFRMQIILICEKKFNFTIIRENQIKTTQKSFFTS